MLPSVPTFTEAGGHPTNEDSSGKTLVDALQQAARMKGSGQFQDDFTLIVIQDKD